MKTVITKLSFPCEIKDKIKMKISTGNLKINFLPGHLIKINNTNISIEEPHRIIVKKDNMVLLVSTFVSSFLIKEFDIYEKRRKN